MRKRLLHFKKITLLGEYNSACNSKKLSGVLFLNRSMLANATLKLVHSFEIIFLKHQPVVELLLFILLDHANEADQNLWLQS